MSLIGDHLSCQDFVESVTAYWEGGLAEPGRDRFEEHYLVCPPCRAYSDQMRLTTSLLARLGGGTGARHAPEPAGDNPAGDAGETADGVDPPDYVRAVKFLAAGAVAPFSGIAWPRPTGAGPAAWVEGRGDPRPCAGGVHACRPEDLPYWLNDELWTVELDGVAEAADRKVVARRGRLIARIDSWDPAMRAAFVDGCLDALRRTVVDLLGPRLPGGPDAVLALPLVEAAAEVERVVPSVRLSEEEREVRGYFTDAIAYRDFAPAVAFICAAATEGARPGGRDEERQRQAAWLREHLGLD